MGAIFDGVELATFLTWERWRWWRGVRDIWSARDDDARRHRRGLVVTAVTVAAVLVAAAPIIREWFTRGRVTIGAPIVLLFLLGDGAVRCGIAWTTAAHDPMARWFRQIGVASSLRAARELIRTSVVLALPSLLVGVLCAPRSVAWSVVVVTLGGGLGVAALTAWLSTRTPLARVLMFGALMLGVIRAGGPGFAHVFAAYPPGIRWMLTSDLIAGLRQVAALQPLLLVLLGAASAGVAGMLQTKAEGARGVLEDRRARATVIPTLVGSPPVASSSWRALAARDALRLRRSLGIVPPAEWAGLASAIAIYMMLSYAPAMARSMLADGNVALLVLLGGLPATLVLSEAIGMGEDRALLGYLRVVGPAPELWLLVRSVMVVSVLLAFGAVLTALLSAGTGDVGLTLAHAVLWIAVACAAGIGYVAATVVVLATDMDGSGNARILRCVGTSLGVAVPTLTAVSGSSVALGVLVSAVWCTAAGLLAWYVFRRIPLASSAGTAS